jgi:hypothetical protein
MYIILVVLVYFIFELRQSLNENRRLILSINEKIDKNISQTVSEVIALSERNQNNLVTAIKSYTVQDYADNIKEKPVEYIKPEPEEEFVDLLNLAEEDGEKFDKLILE